MIWRSLSVTCARGRLSSPPRSSPSSPSTKTLSSNRGQPATRDLRRWKNLEARSIKASVRGRFKQSTPCCTSCKMRSSSRLCKSGLSPSRRLRDSSRRSRPLWPCETSSCSRSKLSKVRSASWIARLQRPRSSWSRWRRSCVTFPPRCRKSSATKSKPAAKSFSSDLASTSALS